MKASNKSRLKKLEERHGDMDDPKDCVIIFDFDKQRFISGELEVDSYQRLKSHTLEQIDKLNVQVADLEITDTAFQKYTKYGMSLLKDLAWYFKEAGLEAKEN